MSVKDLISAIASGSAIETENAFNQVMSEKISARLDDMRVDVAQSMFKEAACGMPKKKMKTEAECDEDEMKEELNLEDYSAEEIEEFMQTEDYEQLDELSKATLGSYVKKAGQHRVRLAGTEKELDDKDYAIQKVKHGMDNDSYNAMSTAQDSVRKQRNKVSDKSMSRSQGINTAIKKLTK